MINKAKNGILKIVFGILGIGAFVVGFVWLCFFLADALIDKGLNIYKVSAVVSAGFLFLGIVLASIAQGVQKRHTTNQIDDTEKEGFLKILLKPIFLLKPFYIFFCAFAISACFYFAPIVCRDLDLGIQNESIFTKTIIIAHNVIKLFVVDADYSLVTSITELNISGFWRNVYGLYGAAFYVLAPVCTAVTLLSFVKDFFLMWEIKAKQRSHAYIFSELNEMSLSIAKDVAKDIKNKGARIIFTDVYDTENEKIRELIVNAERLGAICLNRDVIELRNRWFVKSGNTKYYFIGTDQDENTKQALVVLERYNDYYSKKESKIDEATVVAQWIESQIKALSSESNTDAGKDNIYLRKMLDYISYYQEIKVVGTIKVGKCFSKKQRLELLANEDNEFEANANKYMMLELDEATTDNEKKNIKIKFKRIEINDKKIEKIYNKIRLKVAKLKAGTRALGTTPSIYVYAMNAESELLLDGVKKKYLHVRRISENRNLVFETMNLESGSIFDDVDSAYRSRGIISAKQIAGDSEPTEERIEAEIQKIVSTEPRGEKQMNIAIIGLGGYGMELLKTLSWLGQAKGYYLNAFVFDGENGKEKLEVQAPEMLEYNFLGDLDADEDDKAKGKKLSQIDENEASYSIHFYNNINVKTTKFLDKIAEIDKKYNLTSIYVTLGNDSLNVQTAMSIRRKLARQSKQIKEPKLYAVVFNDRKADVLRTAQGNSSKGFNIEYIGNLGSAFSQKTIEQKKYEDIGFEYHSCWANAYDVFAQRENRNDYDKTEYFRRSSMAQALFYELTYDKIVYESITELARCEHNRWNAFMRADGFVVCDSKKDKDVFVRKTHHNLTPFKELSSYDQSKDYAFLVKNDKVQVKDKSALGKALYE